MSYKNKSSSNKSNSRTFFWTSKKTHPKKKNTFNYPKKKEYTEECDTSSQKENVSENIPKTEEEPKIEDEYQGLIYHPPYPEIIPAGIIYFIETEKKEDYNNFKTKWKTEICRYWEMYGECKFGENCAFAHGDSELKQRKLTFNYKTKPCKQFFENGFCNYGSRCQFSHKREYFNSSDVSYLKCLNEFNNFEKIDEKMLKRPRLLTFEIIVHSNDEERKENRMKLYEDFISIKNEMKFSEDSTTSGSLYSEKNNNKRNRFMSV
jgi:hypothetical protein